MGVRTKELQEVNCWLNRKFLLYDGNKMKDITRVYFRLDGILPLLFILITVYRKTF